MVSRLSGALVKKNTEIDVVLFDTSSPAYSLSPDVQIVDIGIRHRIAPSRFLARTRRLGHYIKEQKPDAIYCFIVSMIPFAVIARFFSHASCQIIGAERTNPHCGNKIIRFAISLFLPFVDGFVFQTDGARHCYPKFVQGRSTVIGNIAPQVALCRESASIIPCGICSVGRLSSDKDFETLLKAFSLVAGRDSDATLHIYGEGSLKEKLAALAESLGIGGSVFFEGFVKDMGTELAKYEIFAFSSRAEGLPNALLEAMASGCACVSSDCDFGPRDLIANGENGFLVPVGGWHDMAEKLLLLLRNGGLRRKLGKNACKVQEIYSEDKIATAYLEYAKSIACK